MRISTRLYKLAAVCALVSLHTSVQAACPCGPNIGDSIGDGGTVTGNTCSATGGQPTTSTGTAGQYNFLTSCHEDNCKNTSAISPQCGFSHTTGWTDTVQFTVTGAFSFAAGVILLPTFTATIAASVTVSHNDTSTFTDNVTVPVPACSAKDCTITSATLPVTISVPVTYSNHVTYSFPDGGTGFSNGSCGSDNFQHTGGGLVYNNAVADSKCPANCNCTPK